MSGIYKNRRCGLLRFVNIDKARSSRILIVILHLCATTSTHMEIPNFINFVNGFTKIDSVDIQDTTLVLCNMSQLLISNFCSEKLPMWPDVSIVVYKEE